MVPEELIKGYSIWPHKNGKFERFYCIKATFESSSITSNYISLFKTFIFICLVKFL